MYRLLFFISVFFLSNNIFSTQAVFRGQVFGYGVKTERRALNGVVVRFYDSENVELRCVTKLGGYFEMNIPSGSFRITAEATGYRSLNTNYSIIDGTSYEVRIIMIPNIPRYGREESMLKIINREIKQRPSPTPPMVVVKHDTVVVEKENVKKSISEKRLALVIGNANYISTTVLNNPLNDARAMQKVLTELGFTVFLYENCNQKQMKNAIDNFGKKLRNFDTGLFFYAGHGIQVDGYNYLIPVDADLKSSAEAEFDCVRADRVLSCMEQAKCRTNIIILDACRDNPFATNRSSGKNNVGLAFMNAPCGSLIAYATSPGSTASDGITKNGLYTSALLQHIRTPGITVLQMLQNVRKTVKTTSKGSQIPWESTSLEGDFFFANP